MTSSRRSWLSYILMAFWGAAPIALLILGTRSAQTYATTAADVNLAGQLRYRSLLLRDLAGQKKMDEVRSVLAKMKQIRSDLRQRYPDAAYFSRTDFEAFVEQVDKQAVPSFEITMKHVEAADRFTGELADSSENYLRNTLWFFSVLAMLFLLGLVLLIISNSQLKEVQNSLNRFVEVDGPTGAFTRRKLFERLSQMSQGGTEPYVVVVSELEAASSAGGDGSLLPKVIELGRTAEFVGCDAFRYADHSVVWILPATTLSTAREKAERLRVAANQATFAANLSFGISASQEGALGAQVLERADRAVQLAKMAGGRCVRIEEWSP
jgi:GGDEF domain-containing protein